MYSSRHILYTYILYIARSVPLYVCSVCYTRFCTGFNHMYVCVYNHDTGLKNRIESYMCMVREDSCYSVDI
jgi:hypothetical protein